VGRALADPTRCRLLVALLAGPGFPAELAQQLGLTRSNVSNHLACLRGCGLVNASYQGRQVRYELADAHLARALGELVDVVLAVEPGPHCLDDPPVPTTTTGPAALPRPPSTTRPATTEVVPSSWQRGGPFSLAGDTRRVRLDLAAGQVLVVTAS